MSHSYVCGESVTTNRNLEDQLKQDYNVIQMSVSTLKKSVCLKMEKWLEIRLRAPIKIEQSEIFDS